MKKIAVSLCLCAFAVTAQVPSLLKDINTGAGASAFGSFAEVPGNSIVFGVNTASAVSRGLWTSDGSVAGTRQLRSFTGTVSAFCAYNNEQFFTTGTPGHILWHTDGTVAGTDSILTPGLTAITGFTTAGNLLLFTATSTLSGTELWRSDGTTAGTFMLKDIWSGAGSAVADRWNFACVYNNELYFTANDGIGGTELWKTDGTTAGTALVRDICPGSGASSPFYFTVSANGIFFIATDCVHGRELWFSDGTTSGTKMVKDLNPGPGNGQLSRILIHNGYAYFTSGKLLYRTDGSSANTTSMNAMGITNAAMISNGPMDNGRVYNNQLWYLSAATFTGVVPALFDSLYFVKADLALTSPTIVARVAQFGAFGMISSLGDAYNIGSNFIYTYYTTNNANGHLLAFDPPNNIVRQYYNQVNVTSGTPLKEYQVFGNKLYMPYSAPANPAFMDLTTDSIRTIKNLNTAMPFFCGGASNNFWEHKIYEFSGKKYVIVNDGSHGAEWWETDFTAGGTSLLIDIYPGNKDFEGGPMFDCPAGKFKGIQTASNIFFAADNGSTGLELWSFVTYTPSTAGLVATERSADAHIFPNPAKDAITISSVEGISSVIITNAVGMRVSQIQGTGERAMTASLETFAPGIYFVNIATGKGSVVKKVIKSN